MPISEDEAVTAIKNKFPEALIQGPASYRDLFLFQVYTDDPDEGSVDPYFSVDKDSGAINEFSVLTDGNLTEIADLTFSDI